MTEIIDRNIVKSALINRRDSDDKFSVGTMLSICGSYGMAGAAIMSAKASLRAGVGLLRMIIPDSIYPIMATAVPEAVFCPVAEKVSVKDISFIEKLNNNDCVLIGCGLGVNSYSKEMLYTVLENSRIPVVIDADAINIIAKNPDVIKATNAPIVITPHIGEMSRLTKQTDREINIDRESCAVNFAKEYNVITVLKGHKTLVASPKGTVMKNDLAGNSGMAVGGSGDVLAGVISSLIAQGGDTFKSACAGVYIHSLAGDIAKEKFGKRSMLPTDMIECLPKAFMTL
ncbi:MAG: NAD(P)H-hydrate dehydratase [Ruminococcus sp.]